ncbi:hypothetical protein EYF80_062702 [Liparis tanakae]|uniref:Uncharacterized protein n=1 Tax=Liparis tanakae TaxID=230148 RepID=A0A4Z2EE45_9TELE|nr:hypothetical protein EYF80_062702 [Liparis tanakae]
MTTESRKKSSRPSMVHLSFMAGAVSSWREHVGVSAEEEESSARSRSLSKESRASLCSSSSSERSHPQGPSEVQRGEVSSPESGFTSSLLILLLQEESCVSHGHVIICWEVQPSAWRLWG